MVVECGRSCVSIFNSTGEKIRSFGSYGSGHGQFNQPWGVAIDDDGNILVVDGGNHRIQKFSSDGRFIVAVGTQGNGQLQFSAPVGINPYFFLSSVFGCLVIRHLKLILSSLF